MRYLIFICACLTLLAGCGPNAHIGNCCFPWTRDKGVTRCDDGPVYEALTYDIQRVAIKYLRERRLKLEDSNIWYGESIDKIRLDFSTMALLDFCETRFLLVDLVEDLIETIECDNTLMTEMEQRYIDPKIIEIYIDFKSFFGKKVDMTYVGWISLENGCVNYYAFDMRTDKLDWWHRRSETYFESRAIARAMRDAEMIWDEEHKGEQRLLDEDRFQYKL